MVAQLYFLFIFLLFLLSFNELKKIDEKKYFFLIFFPLLALITLKDGSVMPDYHMYEYNYFTALSGGLYRTMEPSYYLISILFSPLGDIGFYFVLATYGAVSLFLFFKIVKKFNRSKYSTLLFFSNFFIIFLLIQIRAGIALCFIYLAITERENLKSYFKYIFLAIFFHYSSIIFIPFFLIDRVRLTRGGILILLSIAYFFRLFFLDFILGLISLIPESYVQSKLITYTFNERAEQFEINIFGFFIISKLILLFFFLFTFRYFKKNKELNTFLKLYVSGVLVYISLSRLPEIAVRISNILFFSEIFLIPYFISIFKQQSLVKFLIILFAVIMLYVNLNFTSYFRYQL